MASLYVVRQGAITRSSKKNEFFLHYPWANEIFAVPEKSWALTSLIISIVAAHYSRGRGGINSPVTVSCGCESRMLEHYRCDNMKSQKGSRAHNDQGHRLATLATHSFVQILTYIHAHYTRIPSLIYTSLGVRHTYIYLHIPLCTHTNKRTYLDYHTYTSCLGIRRT